MNLIIFIAAICLAFAILAVIVTIQDNNRIKEEADLRICDDLLCRSLTDTWNPDLLDNCPDYTED